MKSILVILIFATSIFAYANPVECRVIQSKGAKVLDEAFVMDIDVKILSFSLFDDYISTITWPQNTKEMTIVFGKIGQGILSESKARVSASGDSLTATTHISRDELITVSCFNK